MLFVFAPNFPAFEGISVYIFRHVWVLFLFFILPSPPKSPALLTLTYFYSFSFPLLPRIQTTNYFCKVRNGKCFQTWHIILFQFAHFQRCSTFVHSPCFLLWAWSLLIHCQLSSGSPQVTSEHAFKQDKVAVEGLSWVFNLGQTWFSNLVLSIPMFSGIIKCKRVPSKHVFPSRIYSGPVLKSILF